MSLKMARRFCLAAVSLFGVQGMVALLGAAELVIPDLPSPIPFEYGRAIHVNMATLWPLIGTMGLVYYALQEELGRDIFSQRLANWQLWLVVGSALGIYITLAFQIGNGREFFEGLPLFYAGVFLSLVLAAYNVVRTIIRARSNLTPAAAVMTIGIVFLPLLLIPNLMRFSNPIADEVVKFWVVHLWEEMAFELTTSGFIATFIKSLGLAEKRDIDKWLYLEVSITMLTGAFGTAHHYYWIGMPAYWLGIGFIFSIFQLVPVVFLLHMTYKGLKHRRKVTRREKFALWFILSSLLYHVLGAYLLGFLITIPWVNLYMHGTYLTSGHAHMAVFGSLGFLVLGGSYFCLSKGSEPSEKSYKAGVFAALCLNGGLLLMAAALLAGGLLQTYLWRVLGMEFMQVFFLLQPYLIARFLGGGLFTLGDLIFGWQVFKAWKLTRPSKIGYKG